MLKLNRRNKTKNKKQNKTKLNRMKKRIKEIRVVTN